MWSLQVLGPWVLPWAGSVVSCVGWFWYQLQVPLELPSVLGLQVCPAPIGSSGFHQPVRCVCGASFGLACCHLLCILEFECALLSCCFQCLVWGLLSPSTCSYAPIVPRVEVLMYTPGTYLLSSSKHLMQTPVLSAHCQLRGLALGSTVALGGLW